MNQSASSEGAAGTTIDEGEMDTEEELREMLEEEKRKSADLAQKVRVYEENKREWRSEKKALQEKVRNLSESLVSMNNLRVAPGKHLTKKALYAHGDGEWRRRMMNYEHWVRTVMWRNVKVPKSTWKEVSKHPKSVYMRGIQHIKKLDGEVLEVIWALHCVPIFEAVYGQLRGYVFRKLSEVHEGEQN